MPVDRGSIDAQLREIGEGERWWEQREFRQLPYILFADERIQGLAVGKLLGRRRPRIRPAPRWLFVVTDQRLICLKHERLARKQVDVARGQVVRVHHRSGVRSHQITIETRERRHRLWIPKGDALGFAGAFASLVPDAAKRLGPGLEALSWIPGIDTVAALPGFSGIISKVSMLSPPDYATREHVERLEAAIERLQNDVQRLQQQVVFLEDLLQERADPGAFPASAEDSTVQAR